MKCTKEEKIILTKYIILLLASLRIWQDASENLYPDSVKMSRDVMNKSIKALGSLGLDIR